MPCPPFLFSVEQLILAALGSAAALPPDVRKASGLPLSSFDSIVAPPQIRGGAPRNEEPLSKRHSLSTHQAAQPQAEQNKTRRQRCCSPCVFVRARVIRDNFRCTRYNSETLEPKHANCELAKDALRRAAGGCLNNDCGRAENVSHIQLPACLWSDHAAHHSRRRPAALE